MAWKKGPKRITVQAGESHFFCRCGLSEDQPFCDGAHEDTPTEPLEHTFEEGGTYSICACGKTQTPPFCDDSHKPKKT